MLETNLCGIELKNPLIPAAGPPTRDGESILRLAKAGAGAIVAKTISLHPAQVPEPSLASIRGGFINSERWSEISYKNWLEREYPLALRGGVPVIGSIGYEPDELSTLAPLVERAGASAIEFSVHYVEHDPTHLIEIAKAAREGVDIPVFAKLTLIPEIAQIARRLEPWVDGFAAINSLGPALVLDPSTRRPLVNGTSWLSGAAIKPMGLRAVYDIASAVRKPVMGVGGVSSGMDAIEYFIAGASAVQMCTSLILKGPGLIEKMRSEMTLWLTDHGYSSLEDIRGTIEAEYKTGYPEIDETVCNGCGICERLCPHYAIADCTIDKTRCQRCGLCVSICPRGAITWAL